jgi:hypothetical protein
VFGSGRAVPLDRNAKARVRALEWAGVLTWQNRNAYVFRDPLQQPAGVPTSKSENPTGTKTQELAAAEPVAAAAAHIPLLHI